jgi:hypothetical protein
MSEALISTEQIKQIQDALTYWQPVIAPEWVIGFNPEDRPETDDNCRAELARSGDYLMASLRFRPPNIWRVDSEDWPLNLEIEETVVHELGHCIMHDLQSTHGVALSSLGREAWTIQSTHFNHHLERTIERWSRLLVALRHGFDPIRGPG